MDVKGNSISCQRINGVDVSLGHGEVTGHRIPDRQHTSSAVITQTTHLVGPSFDACL